MQEVPLDEIMAVGAAASASAAAGLAMLTALKNFEVIRQENVEYTPEQRLALLTMFLDKLGPEAQAKAIDTAMPNVLEILGIAGMIG